MRTAANRFPGNTLNFQRSDTSPENFFRGLEIVVKLPLHQAKNHVNDLLDKNVHQYGATLNMTFYSNNFLDLIKH